MYFTLFCGSVSLAELREAIGNVFSMFPQSLAGDWLMGAGAQQRLLDM